MIAWFRRERGWWMVNPLFWLALTIHAVATVLCRDRGRELARGK